MPASARSTSCSNRAWRASRRRRTAARAAAGIPRRRFGMAPVSYGDMERTHGLPLDGPGLGALDLEIGAQRAGAPPGPRTTDPAADAVAESGATAESGAVDDAAAKPGAIVDPAAEPVGYLVAMDGGVRIHFLDWGGPTRHHAPAAVEAATDAPAGTPGTLDDAPTVLLVHGLARTACRGRRSRGCSAPTRTSRRWT